MNFGLRIEEPNWALSLLPRLGVSIRLNPSDHGDQSEKNGMGDSRPTVAGSEKGVKPVLRGPISLWAGFGLWTVMRSGIGGAESD